MPVATIERLAAKIPGLKLAELLRRDRNHVALDHDARRIDRDGTATASDCPVRARRSSSWMPNGHELPRGEIGEIWIHGGSVIKGYWNNPKATAESFTGGFWHSGDLGSIDEENFVRVFDRQKDMINRGGLKIYSAEVESVLAGHPDVIESAIIAKTVPGAGRARPRRRGGDAGGVERADDCALVRRAAVGLQGAGNHGCEGGAAAAQRQRQGDEAPVARGARRNPRASDRRAAKRARSTTRHQDPIPLRSLPPLLFSARGSPGSSGTHIDSSVAARFLCMSWTRRSVLPCGRPLIGRAVPGRALPFLCRRARFFAMPALNLPDRYCLSRLAHSGDPRLPISMHEIIACWGSPMRHVLDCAPVATTRAPAVAATLPQSVRDSAKLPSAAPAPRASLGPWHQALHCRSRRR